MIKNYIRLIVAVIAPYLGSGQLTLERESVAAGCFISTWSEGEAEWSIGQIGTEVFIGDDFSAVQGFHQPNASAPLIVDIKVWVNDCDKSYEVEIVSITGCDPNASKTIEWNNATAGMRTKNLPGLSTLRITTSDGCVFLRSYDLSALNPSVLLCDLRPFNYLTPNGDGDNDYFHIENIDRPNYKGARVVIYNRWGQLIWEGKNYDNVSVRWTGKNASGAEVPAGTYFFTIEVLGNSKTGYVELMQ